MLHCVTLQSFPRKRSHHQQGNAHIMSEDPNVLSGRSRLRSLAARWCLREDRSGRRIKHLAGSQHIRDGFAAQVGRGDHVLLLSRVPRSHRFGRCRGDALGHTGELLRCGGLLRDVLGLEELKRWELDRHRKQKYVTRSCKTCKRSMEPERTTRWAQGTVLTVASPRVSTLVFVSNVLSDKD